jgi:16S rRNA C967 or C1407 C5-methylase (RsmB/RsmF family)/NOL1/NOP2/fmu family ribosome biogenesis protein
LRKEPTPYKERLIFNRYFYTFLPAQLHKHTNQLYLQNMDLPQDFRETLKTLLPDQVNDITGAMGRPPSYSIRINPKKWPIQKPELESVPWCPDAFYLKERPLFTMDPYFHAGAFYPQEASSMFLSHIIKQLKIADSPITALDLCAAPGGKTTLLSDALHSDSVLLANEVIKPRANILAENVVKWGRENVIVTQNDPSKLGGLQHIFDLIVVDAPCSGEGMFRKDPESIAEWSTDNVNLCSARQRRILSDIWPALAPGGHLIYSTCTYNQAENEENIQWLMDQQDAGYVEIIIPKEWQIETFDNYPYPMYRFFPHLIKGEGFSIGIVRKKDGKKDPLKIQSKKTLLYQASATQKAMAEEWIETSSPYFFLHNNTLKVIPEKARSLLDYLYRNYNVVLGGFEIAEKGKKDWYPLHGLAMHCMMKKQAFPNILLNHQEAIEYLSRGNLPNTTQRPQGWSLVSFNNIPLGWVKVLPNRLNNYYPKNWRIKMELKPDSEMTLWHEN